MIREIRIAGGIEKTGNNKLPVPAPGNNRNNKKVIPKTRGSVKSTILLIICSTFLTFRLIIFYSSPLPDVYQTLIDYKTSNYVSSPAAIPTSH